MTEAQVSREASSDAGTYRHPPGPDETFRRENLGRLLIRAFNAFEDYHLRRLREEGFADFTGSETAVLGNVESGGSRITDIARSANVTPQAISQLVAGLERKGYLKSGPDPTDGRARLVRLTDRGLALIARGQEITGELQERWAEILGAEALGQLRRLLVHLVSGLSLDDEGAVGVHGAVVGGRRRRAAARSRRRIRSKLSATHRFPSGLQATLPGVANSSGPSDASSEPRRRSCATSRTPGRR